MIYPNNNNQIPIIGSPPSSVLINRASEVMNNPIKYNNNDQTFVYSKP